MLLKEIAFFTLPLCVAALLHHFIVVKHNLFAPLAYPLDFGIRLGGKRLLGNSKTWRGFITMMLGTGLFAMLIIPVLAIPIRYHAFICGAFLGLGYSLGELPNSFLKRRLRIQESKNASGPLKRAFLFLDHTDSVMGALIALAIVYNPRLSLVALLFVIGTLLHFFIDRVLYKFSYKRSLAESSTPKARITDDFIKPNKE